MNIGIESISFYTTRAVIKLTELAEHNKQNHEKYTIGLGQEEMSVITPNEDIITMSYCSATECLKKVKKQSIGLLLFATESGIDNSKSSACELHKLLNLSEQCYCLDIKHACYGGTGAIFLAKNYIAQNNQKKALVIMSDIAFYGLDTKGEPTQGCGSVAILLSSKPKIAILNNDETHLTENKNDFYRPTYQKTPLYDGHLSIKTYIDMFKKTLKIYNSKYKNFDFLVTHMPFAKMLDKCCNIANINGNLNQNFAIKMYQKSIGNTYTASLYIGLISLLENSKLDLTDKKIGMYSYGSGSECELFSIKILKNYKNHLNKSSHQSIINNRTIINYEMYCRLWKEFDNRESKINWSLSSNNNYLNSPIDYTIYGNDKIELQSIKNGIRLYKKILSD